MSDDEPDRMTLERARRRDRPAQAAVLRAVQDRLWRVCLSLLADRALAEDAVQETALRVLAGLPGFDGRSRFTTWATGVAVNVCREMRRRRRHDRLDAPGEAFAADEAALLAADDVERLYRALDDLPERQREATVLRFLEGLDVRQTAELMGCAEGSVKASVHAGLRNLRKALAADESAEPAQRGSR